MPQRLRSQATPEKEKLVAVFTQIRMEKSSNPKSMEGRGKGIMRIMVRQSGSETTGTGQSSSHLRREVISTVHFVGKIVEGKV